MSREITFKEAKELMHKNALRSMEKAVVMVEADAKMMSPVDTGTLKRSITHDVQEANNEIIGVVGTPVEYAYWAEKRQPYLEPAVDQNLEQIKRMFAEELGKR